jgi:hypothetical protein
MYSFSLVGESHIFFKSDLSFIDELVRAWDEFEIGNSVSFQEVIIEIDALLLVFADISILGSGKGISSELFILGKLDASESTPLPFDNELGHSEE